MVRLQQHRNISEEEAQKMYDLKSHLFHQLPEPPIMPGILSLMDKIKEGGIQIGVVTGSGQHTLLDKLLGDFPGLLSEELMVTAFDVTHGKPNPEPYIIGMRKCEVQPWEAIVVENAPLGVRAAHAAHCFTIAVNTGPLPNDMLLREGADLIYPKMTALSDDWKTLIANL
jgi:HAD superfamily hydrolase (TIGR01509 family)